MQKKLLILFFLLPLSLFAQQNLVPNPSFEDTVYCPGSISDYNAVKFWFNPTLHSPDYFHACSDSLNPFSSNVPNNFFGFQHAKDGFGYMGIGVALYNDTREYFSVKLIEPLVAGKQYCVSFYVSLADSVYYATDKIGAYLSTDSIWANHFNALSFIPQISNPSGSFITDKSNWTLISGDFIAVGGEEYLTIGNFYNDSNTDTLAVVPYSSMSTPNYSGAYYYLDVVSVEDCDTTTSIHKVIPNQSSFSIYPNPATDYFNINTNHTDSYDLTIYNAFGQKLYEEKNISSDRKTIATTQFNRGLLFISIKSNHQQFYYKLLKP
jgi:hypothetical protein